MGEKQDAIRLAGTVLDKPYIDPDGDICTLARQLLRAVEREDRLRELAGSFVTETVDYMRRNNLGDPEKQHNVKWARNLGIK